MVRVFYPQTTSLWVIACLWLVGGWFKDIQGLVQDAMLHGCVSSWTSDAHFVSRSQSYEFTLLLAVDHNQPIIKWMLTIFVDEIFTSLKISSSCTSLVSLKAIRLAKAFGRYYLHTP